MARAKAKSKLDPERKTKLERVAKYILGAMKPKEDVYHAEGMHTLPQKQKDGTFKQKPLELGVEYMVSEAYVGARGQVIFCFEPTDAREFQHIEVDEAKMDGVFPMFVADCAAILPGESLGLESMSELIAMTEAHIDHQDAKKAEEKAARQEARDTVDYGDNPEFGMF